MTSLFRRASICAGIAISGFSTFSQAQDTTTVLPPRTELRRALPVAAAPIVQQSPNGLYKLSITDTGIELLGPKGGVKITDAGIEIGAPNTTRVAILTSNMEVKSGQTVKLEAGSNMDIRGGSNIDIRGVSNVDIKGNGTVQITAGGGASLIGSLVKLGCPSGKPIARLGDQVNITASPPVIFQGSPMVLGC